MMWTGEFDVLWSAQCADRFLAVGVAVREDVTEHSYLLLVVHSHVAALHHV